MLLPSVERTARGADIWRAGNYELRRDTSETSRSAIFGRRAARLVILRRPTVEPAGSPAPVKNVVLDGAAHRG